MTALARAERPARSRFALEPIGRDGLGELAGFLHRYASAGAGAGAAPSSERPALETLAAIERHLRWLLVDNPLARPADHVAIGIRDDAGGLAGLDLCFPSAFVAGPRRVVGLGSGAYFVEPRARMLGYFMFKRYLASPGYDFFYATTCNANSAALWKTVGAAAMPGSDTEYVLPFRLDVLLPAFAARKTPSAALAWLARHAGRWADRVLALTRRRTSLTITPCRDWDRLAYLARRHQPADLLTADRSPELLEWRYGAGAPNQPREVYVIADGRGNEGWLALGTITRGRMSEIRGRVLLDAVWPRQVIGPEDLLAAAAMAAAPGADALYVTPRRGVALTGSSRSLLPWRLGAPRAFALAARAEPPLAVDTLDLAAADGDGAF